MIKVFSQGLDHKSWLVLRNFVTDQICCFKNKDFTFTRKRYFLCNDSHRWMTTQTFVILIKCLIKAAKEVDADSTDEEKMKVFQHIGSKSRLTDLRRDQGIEKLR